MGISLSARIALKKVICFFYNEFQKDVHSRNSSIAEERTSLGKRCPRVGLLRVSRLINFNSLNPCLIEYWCSLILFSMEKNTLMEKT